MNRRAFPGKTILFASITLLIILLGFGSFYSYWNSATPEKTCASCHEIKISVNMLAQSAHRDFNCKECHGTALNNGFHSLKEKTMMVMHHVRNKFIEDIRLNERQMLEVMDNCKRCHTTEFANWKSGGHSAQYQHIFLDKKHNSTEQLNPDCLRCHGMFYDETIEELVGPLDKSGPWNLIHGEIAENPVIPCMACHKIHEEGFPLVRPDYSNLHSLSYLRKPSPSKVSFYDRYEKTYIKSEILPKLQLWEGDRSVTVSDEPVMRICIQCHAPNSKHQAGTSDDLTPRGVHEGISCTSCHEPHSNDTRQSCIKCHPSISNCKQDVTMMNTSFADPKSPYNIHWVTCTDCHKDGRK